MRRYLSYPLSKDTPAFGGSTNDFQIENIKEISKGDSCNVKKITLTTHIGTHIDAPFHFFNDGLTISDYPPSFWIFKNIKLIEIPLTSGRWITKNDFENIRIDHNELLLIKTEFCHKRNEKDYWYNNPGLDAKLGKYLRKQYPDLRCIGFDFISLSRWQDREHGRLSHRSFLDPNAPGHPILLIEDMDLRKVSSETNFIDVSVFPLIAEKLDGAPVTVTGHIG